MDRECSVIAEGVAYFKTRVDTAVHTHMQNTNSKIQNDGKRPCHYFAVHGLWKM